MELKPCPWCGVIPTIKWVEWKDISPDSPDCGIYRLEADHLDGCYIRMINGMNLTGQASSGRKERLADAWNRRVNDE